MILGYGDPAPLLDVPTRFNDAFNIQSLAGRFLVLIAFGSLEAPSARDCLNYIAKANLPRDDYRYKIFGMTINENDLDNADVQKVCPEDRVFIDKNYAMSHDYGLINGRNFSPCWIVFDPNLKLYARGGLNDYERLLQTIKSLPRATEYLGADGFAPVLIIPRVIEPELCKEFIRYYEAGNPTQSGFMDQRDGKTFASHDPETKRRKDVVLETPRLREALRERVGRRIVPDIKRAFNADITRIERFIVACYADEDKGFFKMHRDNTTSGTAHRRFAVTINLNADDYDGGELAFPEYGGRRYKAPTGGAVVFGCSLLHEATPVTRGIRYATLPFLYDEAAAKIRLENNKFLDSGVGIYTGADDLIFKNRETSLKAA